MVAGFVQLGLQKFAADFRQSVLAAVEGKGSQMRMTPGVVADLVAVFDHLFDQIRIVLHEFAG